MALVDDKIKIVRQFPADEPVVAMIAFRNWVIIATTRSVYRLRDPEAQVEPVDMVMEQPCKQ